MSVRCSWISGSGRRPARISWSGREVLADVREWSGGPPGYLGGAGRPTWMSGCFRETLLNVRELSGGNPKCQGVVGRLSRNSGNI